MDPKVSRRQALRIAAKPTAISRLALVGQPNRVLGANSRVRVAICGLNGRGKNHINGFSRLPNVEIAPTSATSTRTSCGSADLNSTASRRLMWTSEGS